MSAMQPLADSDGVKTFLQDYHMGVKTQDELRQLGFDRDETRLTHCENVRN